MKLYLRFIGNAFQQNTAYKTNVVMQMMGQLMGLFIQISVWYALYAGNDTAQSHAGAIPIHEMIYYVILSTGISMIVQNQVIGQLDGKIKSGMIAMDLIKPMNFHGNILCHTLGNNLFRITFQFVPLVIIGFIIFGMSLPSSAHFLLFILSLMNAFLLNFILAYILGMIGFWYLSIWHLERLLADIVRLFGGVWIPLWFFPKPLAVISEFLPFQYIYYVPINIYLERLSVEKSLDMLLNQCLWIILLCGLSYIVWRKGIQKLIIQGG